MAAKKETTKKKDNATKKKATPKKKSATKKVAKPVVEKEDVKVVDLTSATTEEVIKAFEEMKDDDAIVVAVDEKLEDTNDKQEELELDEEESVVKKISKKISKTCVYFRN